MAICPAFGFGALDAASAMIWYLMPEAVVLKLWVFVLCVLLMASAGVVTVRPARKIQRRAPIATRLAMMIARVLRDCLVVIVYPIHS